MPLYQVKAMNKSGQIEDFSREYPDLGELQKDLSRSGLLLVEAKEKKQGKKQVIKKIQDLRNRLSAGTVRDEDIYNLFYELGVILKAGVPVMRAFRMIIDETGKESMKKFLEVVLFELKEGRDFSGILEGNEAARIYNFKPYIPIIRMGEKTGKLGESFLNIAASLEQSMKIKSEITNAMIYPMVLLGTSLMALYVMLIYVIPRFQSIVSSFKVVLPFHTRVLFSVSTFLNAHQDVVIIVFIVLLLVLLYFSRKPEVKLYFNRLLNKLPIIRTVKFSSENLHFLHSLSNLLSGGVPILTSLDLALESFSAEPVKNKLKNASLSLRKGESLANALKETAIFPEIVPNMVRVGEESGTLPEVLKELYNFMSERFLKKVKRYMNLLEPLIILFVALFIGLLIMTILPIILNLSDIKF
ncbi:MAG: type II secretion system F family protein [Acidobacteria bacterium]|jgi:type II secretory pathway component PulF|nr:type II secretion system F family protein [Acidobacteriota bacterium]